MHGPLDLTTWASIRRAADLHGRDPFYLGQIIDAALEYAYTPKLQETFGRHFEMCVAYPHLVLVHNVVDWLEGSILE
jgi:hypothetical protein